MSEKRAREPILNAPDVIKWMSGAFIAVHLARLLAGWLVSPRTEIMLTRMFAFDPSLYWGYKLDAAAMISAILGPFTYMFLHGDFMHLAVNTGLLLSFGVLLARRTKAIWFFAFFVLTSLAGAALYLLISFGQGPLMIGASGGISGILGGLLRLSYQNSPAHGGPLSERDKQLILAFAAIWLLVNLFLAFQSLGLASFSSGIAWQAHLGGFIAGVLAVNFFDGRGKRRKRGPNLKLVNTDWD